MTTTAPTTAKRRLPLNVWVMTATSFLTDVSTEMIVHVLPLFLANVLGASTAIIGLIEGAAETLSSLLKIVSGRISDRLGSRKWPAVAGYALSSISKPFLYVASNAAIVSASRLADRAGKGIRTAPRDALIADSIDPEHRGAAFGLHRAGDTAGAVVGIIIALIVVLATQSQTLTLSRETFQILVLFAMIPAFAGVIVLSVGARDVARRSSAESEAPTARASWRALSPDFKTLLLAVALFTLGNSADAFLILRAQDQGMSVAGILALLIAFNTVYALLSAPLGTLSDRIGRRRLIVGGWLLYGLVYLGFAAASGPAMIVVLFLLYGVYYAAAEGAGKALVADLVPAEQRGTAYGLYNGVVGIMALPASALAGVLWQGIGTWPGLGPGAPFAVGALLALGASGILLLRWRGRAA
jgi:MFS family permease